MDKEKVRWALIALTLGAVGLLTWVVTGGDGGTGTLNQISGLATGVALIVALGLFAGALRANYGDRKSPPRP